MVGNGGWRDWGKGMIVAVIELDYNLACRVQAKNAKNDKITKKMRTTYPLKVQAIRSKGQQPRLYVSFPLALAAAIGVEPGESVQWEVLDRGALHLLRPEVAPPRTPHR